MVGHFKSVFQAQITNSVFVFSPLSYNDDSGKHKDIKFIF